MIFTAGQLCLPHNLSVRYHAVTRGVTTVEAIVTPSFTMQLLHRSRQRKAVLHTKIPPSSGVFEGYFRGGIFKQDKGAAHRTDHIARQRRARKKNRGFTRLSGENEECGQIRKICLLCPYFALFPSSEPQILRVLGVFRCLFTAPIPNFKNFKKDEVIPI